MDDNNNRSFFDDEKAEIEDFTESIPVPSDDTEEKKPHKIVRYVNGASEENTEEEYDDEEDEEDDEPRKKGFISDFFSGVAAGAKTVGDSIKAGAESEDEDFSEKDEEISFADDEDDDEDEESEEEKKSGGLMASLGKLSGKTIIIGAALITALVIVLILCFATGGSKNKDKDKPSEMETKTDVVIVDTDTKTDIDDTPVPLEIPSRQDKYNDAKAVNSDVVGWLYIPGLTDVDAGVCQDTKKYSYNKRDITGKSVTATYWINGAYYTHLRNTFGATTDKLSTNTIIFGHSDLGLTNLAYKDDDPTGPLFSQLFSFKDPEFAKKTPYIFLTTEAGDSVWEVFAVFYNDSSIDGGKALWYIEPEPANAYETVLATMQDRSLYDYDVEVSKDDKILTLSTCTVGFGLSTRARYRFVIVSKLVTDPAEIVEKDASFVINDDAPVPDTYREQFQQYVETWNK